MPKAQSLEDLVNRMERDFEERRTPCMFCGWVAKSLFEHRPDCPFGAKMLATEEPMNPAATPEPKPVKNNHPAIADVVASDLLASGHVEIAADVMARKEFGLNKYGTALQPMNGRDQLNDLYQEILDGTKYAANAILENRIRKADFNPELEKIYKDCKDLLIRVYSFKNARKSPDGCAGPSTP